MNYKPRFGVRPEPMCGKGWLDEHRDNVTQTMIDTQTLTVSNGSRTSVLKVTYKIKDIKTVLKGLK